MSKPIEFLATSLNDLRAFRIMYVARFAHAICVLHCFQKKSQKTRKMDLDLAAARYRSLVKELKNA